MTNEEIDSIVRGIDVREESIKTAIAAMTGKPDEPSAAGTGRRRERRDGFHPGDAAGGEEKACSQVRATH